MRAQTRNCVFILVALIGSCYSTKRLDLTKIPQQEIEEIIGTYESAYERHPAMIHIEQEGNFKYEFSSSKNKGYLLGTYSLHGVILTLSSDSLISEEWMDLLHNKENRISRVTDTTVFKFAVTEKGLHNKATNGHFYKESTYIKR